MYTDTHQSTIDEIRGLSILYNFELKKFHRMNSVFRGNSRARTISPLCLSTFLSSLRQIKRKKMKRDARR